MTKKNEIANDINYTAKRIVRTIQTNKQLNFNIGETYDNRGKAESWADQYGDFYVENTKTFEYVLICENVPCHQVDYDNELEVEVLNASNEQEQEVLVPANAIMEIISVATEHDIEEMGYCEVELKFVGFKNE